MDQIDVVAEEDILRIAEDIDSILSRVNERFGCSWDQVGGDSKVRECVDFINRLCDESLPKSIKCFRLSCQSYNRRNESIRRLGWHA